MIRVINGELQINPIKSLLKPEEPPVSIIMPYRYGEELNPLSICANDELIIVFGEKTIGHARIRGARESSYDWLVIVDSDAIYPDNYIPQVKYYIRECGDKYPVMCSIRKGGFGMISPANEHGLIVRKDVFLERVETFLESGETRAFSGEGRADIGKYFYDAKHIPVYYYHTYTKGEKKGVSLLALAYFLFRLL